MSEDSGYETAEETFEPLIVIFQENNLNEQNNESQTNHCCDWKKFLIDLLYICFIIFWFNNLKNHVSPYHSQTNNNSHSIVHVLSNTNENEIF
jgi:hypothetical protein